MKKNIFTLIKNSRTSQIIFQFIADIIAIWIGFGIQLYIRFFSGLIATTTIPTINDYIIGSIMMTCFWIIIFLFGGMYKNWHIKSPFSEFFAVIKVVFLGTLLIVFFIFSDNTTSVRTLFLVYFIISSCSFTLFRYLSRRIQVLLRRKKIIKIPAIVIGDVEHSIKFIINATKNINLGYDIAGIILYEALTENDKIIFDENNLNPNIVLGTIDDLTQIIDGINPEEVVISSGTPVSKILIKIESICSDNKIRVLISPNLYDIFTGQSRTQNLYGIPLIEISSQIMKPYLAIIKRIFDIVFSLLVLIVGLPFWIIIGVIVRLESSGNIIYSQARVGKNNKLFTIYKFRSMFQANCDGPENQGWTAIGDVRVTGFGKFIRKTHIDEIPQFYNVLRGDMSIVGPRPEQPKLVEEFSDKLSYYNRRHTVKPGITGWWQVKYKYHELNLQEIKNRTKDDFYYIENLSLQLDFEIIVRTVWCVFSGHGQT